MWGRPSPVGIGRARLTSAHASCRLSIRFFSPMAGPRRLDHKVQRGGGSPGGEMMLFLPNALPKRA
jgi:hypothetical protein